MHCADPGKHRRAVSVVRRQEPYAVSLFRHNVAPIGMHGPEKRESRLWLADRCWATLLSLLVLVNGFFAAAEFGPHALS